MAIGISGLLWAHQRRSALVSIAMPAPRSVIVPVVATIEPEERTSVPTVLSPASAAVRSAPNMIGPVPASIVPPEASTRFVRAVTSTVALLDAAVMSPMVRLPRPSR